MTTEQTLIELQMDMIMYGQFQVRYKEDGTIERVHPLDSDYKQLIRPAVKKILKKERK